MSVKYIESLASLSHGIDRVEKPAIAEGKKKPEESFGGEGSHLSNWFRTENSENGSFGDKPLLQEEKKNIMKQGRKTRPPLIRLGQSFGSLEISAHRRSPGSRHLF